MALRRASNHINRKQTDDGDDDDGTNIWLVNKMNYQYTTHFTFGASPSPRLELHSFELDELDDNRGTQLCAFWGSPSPTLMTGGGGNGRDFSEGCCKKERIPSLVDTL